MNDDILGLSKNTFYAIVLALLLIILGIVSFSYYFIISTGGGLVLSTGVGLKVPASASMTPLS